MHGDTRDRVTITLAAALALLTSCTSTTATPTAAPTVTAATSITTPVATPAPPPTPVTRTVNWFDLDVGDCLADPPPTDPNVIGVAVVDCETPHQAEVYRRVPLAVDTAVADVADRKCADGFTVYTGEPVGSGTFTVTYLIDSNQDRTSANPDPSTLICLLEAANGRTMTQSAHG